MLLLTAVVAVIVLEILSLSGIHFPAPYEPFIFLAIIVGIGYPVLRSGIRAFYLGEYPEAAVVIVLYVLGERLEEIGIDNSRTALERLVAQTPKTAMIKSSGQEMMIDRIPVGATMIIRPHAIIPIDGIIEEGESTVDEATITGEPIPRDKAKGEPRRVLAYSINWHHAGARRADRPVR